MIDIRQIKEEVSEKEIEEVHLLRYLPKAFVFNTYSYFSIRFVFFKRKIHFTFYIITTKMVRSYFFLHRYLKRLVFLRTQMNPSDVT